MIRFDNKDRTKATRMYSTESPIGIACFMGQYNPRINCWEAALVGYATSQEEASKWLSEKVTPEKPKFDTVLFRVNT